MVSSFTGAFGCSFFTSGFGSSFFSNFGASCLGFSSFLGEGFGLLDSILLKSILSKTLSSTGSSFLGSSFLISSFFGSSGAITGSTAGTSALGFSNSILPKTLASPIDGAFALITSGFLGSISNFSSGTLEITTS